MFKLIKEVEKCTHVKPEDTYGDLNFIGVLGTIDEETKEFVVGYGGHRVAVKYSNVNATKKEIEEYLNPTED